LSKLAALEDAGGVGDDSVYRAQLREMKVANYLHLIELDLTLIVQHKCALPKEPFTAGDYLMDAHECAYATALGHDKTVVCDFAKWRRHPTTLLVPDQKPPDQKPPSRPDAAEFHRPSAAEAWWVCGEAVKGALAPFGTQIRAYAQNDLISSHQDGNWDRFELKIESGVRAVGKPKMWTCAVDYESGVSKIPVVKPAA
jgi:hypothetical protein